MSIITHQTRSINCLIRSPRNHQVTNNNTGYWANLVESFTAAGTWTFSTFNPDTNASFQITHSSLKKRNGQARLMSFSSTNIQGYGSQQLYQYDTNHTIGAITYNGLPQYVFGTGAPAPFSDTPYGPCKMSTFSVNGRTPAYGTAYDPYPNSAPRAIKMSTPSGNNNFSPISFGPTAGL